VNMDAMNDVTDFMINTVVTVGCLISTDLKSRRADSSCNSV
jgi:hypothetical protein